MIKTSSRCSALCSALYSARCSAVNLLSSQTVALALALAPALAPAMLRIGQMPDVSLQSRVAQGFNLIPVSDVGEAVDGVNEAVDDEKIEGNGVEGTFPQRHDQ